MDSVATHLWLEIGCRNLAIRQPVRQHADGSVSAARETCGSAAISVSTAASRHISELIPNSV